MNLPESPTLAEIGEAFAAMDEPYNPANPDHVQLAQSIARKLANAVDSIAIMEEAVKLCRAEKEKLNQRILDLMDQGDMSKTTLAGGLALSVEASPSVDYNVPEGYSKAQADAWKEEKRAALIAWLADNGDAESVKEVIELKGGVAPESMAEVLDYLRESGLNFTRNPEIHAQTLKRILKERLKDGRDLPPFDIAAVKLFRYVTVKREGK